MNFSGKQKHFHIISASIGSGLIISHFHVDTEKTLKVFEHSFGICAFIMIMFVASYSVFFSPPVTDELMYGHIQQNNLCIDIEIGHVPAIAKLGKCSADKDTQVMFCFFPPTEGVG